ASVRRESAALASLPVRARAPSSAGFHLIVPAPVSRYPVFEFGAVRHSLAQARARDALTRRRATEGRAAEPSRHSNGPASQERAPLPFDPPERTPFRHESHPWASESVRPFR